ncbi:hypothetical protein BDR26DRAFT_489550 [Obelidium mucronatum]|nr:hypothetical protein BDR26DRAFT_489550 [Obelidium mucronatum]
MARRFHYTKPAVHISADSESSVYSTCSWIFWKNLELQIGASAFCLDWNADGSRLLIGGTHFSIWDFKRKDSDGSDVDPQPVWTIVSPSPVKMIRYSPNGDLFASIADNDRFVKIWYTVNTTSSMTKSLAYDFLYLPHAVPVSTFEWRKQNGAGTNGFSSMNAILTVTADSVSRIWCQTNTSNSLTHSAARKRHNNAEFEMRASIVPDLGTTSLHWVQGRAVAESIEGSNKETGGSFQSGKKLKGRGATAIKDYPDMLFAVGKEGSVVVWGIQGLEGHPQRVPKVVIILKTQSGVLPGDFEAFMGNIEIFYDSRLHEDSAIYFPAQISMLAKSAESGLLNLYSMNLDEFFGSPWANPYLRLEHSWCGHKSRVEKFSRHPSLHIVASMSVDNEVNFYRISLPQVAIRVNDGLDLISHRKFGPGLLLINWIPNNETAVICDGNTICLLQIALLSDNQLVPLEAPTLLFPITFVHVIHNPSFDQSTTKSVFFIIGVSIEDRGVYIWEAVFEGSSFISDKATD